MNTFIGGIAVGFVLFGIMASVIIFNRMLAEIERLTKEADSMNKTLQMMFLKITKIEKVTQNTMEAAETFVDGLRASAEQLQQQIINPPRMGRMTRETFDDLRQSFEEGIKNMEEGIEETDEDSDEQQEPWK